MRKIGIYNLPASYLCTMFMFTGIPFSLELLFKFLYVPVFWTLSIAHPIDVFLNRFTCQFFQNPYHNGLSVPIIFSPYPPPSHGFLIGLNFLMFLVCSSSTWHYMMLPTLDSFLFILFATLSNLSKAFWNVHHTSSMVTFCTPVVIIIAIMKCNATTI